MTDFSLLIKTISPYACVVCPCVYTCIFKMGTHLFTSLGRGQHWATTSSTLHIIVSFLKFIFVTLTASVADCCVSWSWSERWLWASWCRRSKGVYLSPLEDKYILSRLLIFIYQWCTYMCAWWWFVHICLDGCKSQKSVRSHRAWVTCHFDYLLCVLGFKLRPCARAACTLTAETSL